ncbi:MAG: 5-formyltetrahydrofolate cyclo-ligase [Clostridia bacterium]|nr:5-formyltetrahydrofolate cyclo-ligase [Clostridia bacterium]
MPPTSFAARYWLTDMEKQELRAQLKEKRNSISPEEKKRMDRAIVERIAASREFRDASAVLLYAPYGSEIDLLPLVRLSRKIGKTVAFPRCDTASNTMQFYILEPDARLVMGAYRIPEPAQNAPLCQLDEHTLCILPGLTFDKSGKRLGYGKGYYDRFLADFKGITAGAVYENLLSDDIPTEEHDRSVGLLFTEAQRYTCGSAQPAVVAKKEEPTAKKTVKRKMPPWGLHAPPVLVACTFLLLLLSRLIDTHLTNRNNEYIVVILLQIMIFIIPAVIYGKLRGDSFAKRIRIRPIHRRHIWFTACMLVVMITGGLLLCILTGGISSLIGNFTLYDTFVARINGNAFETVYVILAYCILPAFCEEMVYRSILCAEYERFGAPIAITASALFFAMLHFSFPLFPTYLFLGALLAASLYTTRSFFAVFLLHVLYNLFCLFGQPYLSAFYVNAGNNKIFVFCLVTLFLLFSAFAAGEARKIYHRYAIEGADSSYTQPIVLKEYPKKLGTALFSPAAAACAVIFLIMATVNLFI